MKKALACLLLIAIAIGCSSENPVVPTQEPVSEHPDTLYINISDADFELIKAYRDTALLKGRLSGKSKKDVAASFQFKGKNLAGTLRLKGDLPDHWKGDQWSYRIEIDKGKMYGTNKFSIQDPATRNGQWEALFHALLKEQGIPNLEYRFIEVVQNGESKGLYAFESHFTKDVWKRAQLPKGVLLRYDENNYWKKYQKFPDRDSMYIIYNAAFSDAKVEWYNNGSIKSDSTLKQHAKKAKKMLTAYRKGELSAGEVFDTERMGTYIAVCDYVNAWHALLWGNMRFYYNPETGKLQPVGFDADAGLSQDPLACEFEKFNALNSEFFNRICADPNIKSARDAAFAKLTSEAWKSAFFDAHSELFSKQEKWFQKADSAYRFDPKTFLEERTEFLKN